MPAISSAWNALLPSICMADNLTSFSSPFSGHLCREAAVLSYFSCVCATLWTVVCEAPLSMGFSRQEYWSLLPFPPPWDLPRREGNRTLFSYISLHRQEGSLPLAPSGSFQQIIYVKYTYVIIYFPFPVWALVVKWFYGFQKSNVRSGFACFVNDTKRNWELPR